VSAFYGLHGSLRVNDADPAVGWSAVTEVARGFMTAFPDLQLTMDDVRIEGERAIYHWTFSGSNTGPGGAGHRVRFSGFEVWELGADGLIAESRGHFDEASYQRQLKHGITMGSQ
jgi:predicted ester cyclase